MTDVPVPAASTPYLTFALLTPFPVSGPDEPPRFLSVNGRETFTQSMRSTSYDASTQSTSFEFATGTEASGAGSRNELTRPGSIDSPSDRVGGGADSFSLLAFAYAPTLSSPRPRDWTSSHCSPRIVESMHYRGRYSPHLVTNQSESSRKPEPSTDYSGNGTRIKTVGVSDRVVLRQVPRSAARAVTRNGGKECGENWNYDPH